MLKNAKTTNVRNVYKNYMFNKCLLSSNLNSLISLIDLIE